MSQYSLNVCHLYGNLLNTYGDNGNLLVLDYLARQANIDFHSEIISIDEELDETQYDLFFLVADKTLSKLSCHAIFHVKPKLLNALLKMMESCWRFVGAISY